MIHITKDGIEVKVGQLWRDCDRRVGVRIRRVAAITNDGRALMAHPETDKYPTTKVSIRRMYRHSTGWVLVKDV